MVDEWPSHSEELSRKTTGVLEKWTSAYDNGKITKREYYIVVSTLYDATSGLIPDEIRDLLSNIHAELRGLKA